jgi:single-strand DNA-binding protein
MRRIEMIGNLGRDPEMSYSSAGLAVTNFSVAASDGKDRNGNEDMQWVRVVCFGKQAENAIDFLKKGKKVFVRGKISLSKYRKKDGTFDASLEVVASEIEYLSPRDVAPSTGNFEDTLAGIAESTSPF